MLLSLLINVALADSAGLGLTTIALRSSAGNHRQHLGINVWKKSCALRDASQENKEIEQCVQYAFGIGENIHLIPNGRMISTVLQPKVLYGVQLGVLPMKIGFSVGVGVNGIIGGAETFAWKIQPGLIGALELEQPIGKGTEKDWVVRLEANQMIYGLGSNYGMVLGGAKKW